jgi:ABC-type polysaccharide/polyol phosphate transport system ATPase subunit
VSVNAVEVEGLGKRYRLGEDHGTTSVREALTRSWRHASRLERRARRPEIWALRDVDLAVSEGEAVGVIGRNGAGKSTLLKILSRITEPTSGVSRTRGRVASLLEVGTGFHPELTGRENVFLNGAILGMTRRDIVQRFDEIVSFSGVEPFIDTPIKRFSTGMYLRLAFAVAAHLEPDVLLVDEVLAVGDAEFQAKCLRRMESVGDEGRTVVFVSHNLGAVGLLCTRTIWLDGGGVRATGPTAEVVQAYVQAQTLGEGTAWQGTTAGPVTVHDVRVTDATGRPAETLQRDEPMVIEVRYTLGRRVQGFDLAAFVLRAGGPEILCESWGDTATERAGEPGTYVARLQIPPVLNIGDHVVGLWMGDPYDTFIHEMAVRRFHLAGDAQNRPNRAVALRLPWQVERAEHPIAGKAADPPSQEQANLP